MLMFLKHITLFKKSLFGDFPIKTRIFLFLIKIFNILNQPRPKRNKCSLGLKISGTDGFQIFIFESDKCKGGWSGGMLLGYETHWNDRYHSGQIRLTDIDCRRPNQ
jgi:hypothetical protein